MSNCPCGSKQGIDDCCGLYIRSGKKPETAEQLMRARYTAHTLADIGFIVRSHHPASRSDIDESSTAKWARESEWLGLDILDVDGGQADDKHAKIEFIARYRDGNSTRHDHTEIAIFEKHNNDWYFKDAEMPKVRQFVREVPKQGRNEPCSCGSGKKFKKCCGAN